MLLHSRREKEAAIVFGVTDPFGVTLVNRTHQFPLLVEEEEKTHGALLANTTHGALYRALGSIRPWSDANIIITRQPDEDISDLIPLRVYNRIRALKDRTLARALSVHEAFAKYCAFCFQYSIEPHAQASSLDRQWEEEVNRYDLLLDIARTIAEPKSVRHYHSAFRIAYAAAKVILNIGDFDALLSIESPRQLYDKLAATSSNESLKDRFDVVMSAIEGVRSRQPLEYETYLSGEKRLEPKLLEALRRANLHEHLGIDTATLSARSVLLGKRLETLAAGVLHCHLESGHLGWSFGEWVDLDKRFLKPDGRLITYANAQSIGGRLGSDPSLTVSYDCFSNDGIWQEGRLDAQQLEAMREVVVYLTPASDSTIDSYVILKEDIDCKPVMFVDRGREWKTLKSELARVSEARLIIVMLPAAFGFPSSNVPPPRILSDSIGRIGNIVYWVPTLTPSHIIDDTPYIYRRCDGVFNNVGRGPVGLLSATGGYATIGSVPNYVVDIVARVLSNAPPGSFGIRKLPSPITTRINDVAQTVFDSGAARVPAAVVAAARVYEHFYEIGELPGPLPLYDPMNLFDILYNSEKGCQAMTHDESLSEIVAAASLEMSEAHETDYDICKSYILFFLGIEDEDELYNLRLKTAGDAESSSLRHVIKNSKKIRVVDIVQAVTTVSAVAVAAPDKQKVTLAAVTAGLYFIKAFRGATSIKLEPADASILWSLNRIGNDASISDLLADWRHVVAGSEDVDADTSEAKLNARLRKLEDLGCVSVADGRVSFVEDIADESVNPKMP